VPPEERPEVGLVEFVPPELILVVLVEPEVPVEVGLVEEPTLLVVPVMVG
jgi:hypothetical protein